MKKTTISLLLLVFATFIFAQQRGYNVVASKQKRLALVVGNSAYPGGSYLKNPVNDANLMASTLQGLGFTVIKRVNTTKATLERAIYEYSRKLKDYDVALFYYAGHGIQVDGKNYIIPIDAKLTDKTAVKFEAVGVNYVVEEFEAYRNHTNIVILDACRDNPFRSWGRGGARGFKAMNPASGTIIAFATSEGSTAADGRGSNGLYTTHLTKQLKIGQSIESVFKKTRVAVQNASNGAQSPQEWTKLTGDFYFKKPTGNTNTNVSNNNNEISITEDALPPGTIKLTSKISGSLYIDGQNKGSLSSGRVYTLKKISPGTHLLKINNWEQTVYVASDQTHNVTAINNSNKPNDLPSYLTDSRDGKRYKIVEIGSQVWMAENLAFKTARGSWAYDNSQSNLTKYGYLYNWQTAKTVCPSGWRLPTKSDFETLLNNYGGSSNSKANYTALIPSGNSGFSASFGGYRRFNGYCSSIGKNGYFWSSSTKDDTDAWKLHMYSYYNKASMEYSHRSSGDSVRCIQDN